MPRAGLRILQASFLVRSNRDELLPSFRLKVEVPSLLTDLRSVDPNPCPASPDGKIVIQDVPGRPTARDRKSVV